MCGLMFVNVALSLVLYTNKIVETYTQKTGIIKSTNVQYQNNIHIIKQINCREHVENLRIK